MAPSAQANARRRTRVIRFRDVVARFALVSAGAILLTAPFALYYVLEKPSISQGFYTTFASLILCSLFLVLSVVTRHSAMRISRADLPVALFALINLLSVLIRPSLMFGLERFAALFGFVAFYFLATHSLTVCCARMKLLAIVTLTALLVSLYGLMQYFGYEFIGFERRQMLERFHIVSFLGNPAFVSSFLVPASFICLCLALVGRKPVGKLAGCAGVLAAVVCIFLAGSRSGWLSLFASFAVFGVLSVYSRRVRVPPRILAVLLVMGAMLVLLFSMPNPFFKPKYNIFKRVFSATQIEARLYAWSIARDMFVKHPLLGMGYGNFNVKFWEYVDMAEKRAPTKMSERVLSSARGLSPGHAHNEYVEVLAESGLAGFAAFLWLIGACVRKSYRRLRSREAGAAPEQAVVTLCLLCGFLALLIDSFFSFPLHLPCSALIFWLLVAFLARDVSDRQQASSQ
jgi:putative inorganic carbon (HCO3(-)) transporter